MKTPQISVPKLAAALGITTEVWFKREDRHHYGSHKGRSIPLMIAEHHKAGANSFVISSSGNAALAAGLTVQAHNKNKAHDPLTLRILVGQKIEEQKLSRLKKELTNSAITIERVDNPKQQALQQSQADHVVFLRQSTDDLALTGYFSLAQDLSKISDLAAVFVPTSSGTTAQGLYEGFKQLGINPEIHIVQTTSCHPMVEMSQHPLTPLPGGVTTLSLATAIVDKVAHRKEKVLEDRKSVV